MFNPDSMKDDEIVNTALAQLPQPNAFIRGDVESREQLADLIDRASLLPNCQDCQGVAVPYRTVEHLFPGESPSPYAFNLTIPDYSEITRWANEHSWGVDYLPGTEHMTFRAFFFVLHR